MQFAQLSFRNFHVTNFKLRWNWINCDTQYERLKKVFLQIMHKFFQNKLAHLSSFYRTSMCNKLSCDRNPFSNPPKKKRFCLEQCTLAFYFSCNKNHHIVSHEHKHTNTDYRRLPNEFCEKICIFHFIKCSEIQWIHFYQSQIYKTHGQFSKCVRKNAVNRLIWAVK